MAAPATASAPDPLVSAARAYLLASASVKRETAELCVPAIVAAARILVDALRRGGKILICGNGGSAADSQHLAAEFVSVLDKNRRRPALSALALTTDTSILTAVANDFGYAGVFARQVEALGRPGDVLVGISTSGNSDNVLEAMEMAARRQIRTIVLTGAAPGRIGRLAELAVPVPSTEVQHIQEAHLAVEHLLCLLTEIALFEEAL